MKSLDDLISRHRPKVPSAAEFPRQVGERIRRQRMAFHWRQVDLAERAGVSESTIKAMEKGSAISSDNLLRLLLALGHGADVLKMLDAPHYPNLDAQARFFGNKSISARTLATKRVRPKL
ncbi:helix-turn-helix domain-containing protein [Dyella choica]|uniref:XRE family transcriptional regulator n=1 Tax=Dyella choica TaxID=1927959 RepID=A0A3S0RWI9_9GAMM|nr:helix-turn-helix transcriptional regulator [Dyella choica]RUL67696.1 XRE family transcriptional regulator [Dyella choica]